MLRGGTNVTNTLALFFPILDTNRIFLHRVLSLIAVVMDRLLAMIVVLCTKVNTMLWTKLLECVLIAVQIRRLFFLKVLSAQKLMAVRIVFPSVAPMKTVIPTLTPTVRRVQPRTHVCTRVKPQAQPHRAPVEVETMAVETMEIMEIMEMVDIMQVVVVVVLLFVGVDIAVAEKRKRKKSFQPPTLPVMLSDSPKFRKDCYQCKVNR